MATEALVLAKEKAASMDLEDIAARIGGTIIQADGIPHIRLPYFNGFVRITPDRVTDEQGQDLTRAEIRQ